MGQCATVPQVGAQQQQQQQQQQQSDSAVVSPRARGKSSKPASSGCLVLVELEQEFVRSTSSVLSAAEQQQEALLYLCRTDQWRGFHAAGFLVEALQVGAGGDCVHDVLLAGPPSVLGALEQQLLDHGGAEFQQHTHTHTLRLRWEALQRLPGIKAIALAAPTTPLTTTEAARLKAFAASLAYRDQEEDLGQRARILSARARKAFLPALVGEALVATGHLQRSGPDLYSARRGTWTMPDLHFVDLGQHRGDDGGDGPASASLSAATSLPWAGFGDTASSTSTARQSILTVPSSLSSAASADAKAPSRQGRREQQAQRQKPLAGATALTSHAVHPTIPSMPPGYSPRSSVNSSSATAPLQHLFPPHFGVATTAATSTASNALAIQHSHETLFHGSATPCSSASYLPDVLAAVSTSKMHDSAPLSTTAGLPALSSTTGLAASLPVVAPATLASPKPAGLPVVAPATLASPKPAGSHASPPAGVTANAAAPGSAAMGGVAGVEGATASAGGVSAPGPTAEAAASSWSLLSRLMALPSFRAFGVAQQPQPSHHHKPWQEGSGGINAIDGGCVASSAQAADARAPPVGPSQVGLANLSSAVAVAGSSMLRHQQAVVHAV